jgi:hypothetical protein
MLQHLISSRVFNEQAMERKQVIKHGTFRYEIHAIIEDVLNVIYADKVEFELEGFVNITPKQIVTPEKSWEPKNLEITLPNHVIHIITEYKPLQSTS